MDDDEMFDMNGFIYLDDNMSSDAIPISECLNLSQRSVVLITVPPEEIWDGLQEEGNQ